MQKYFTLLIPVGYCSSLRMIRFIPVPYDKNDTGIRLVAWFGLCFRDWSCRTAQKENEQPSKIAGSLWNKLLLDK